MTTNTKIPSYNPKNNNFNNEFLSFIFKDDAIGTVFKNKPHFYGLIQYKGHKVLVLGCTELMTWIATALARNNAVTYITHEKELYEKFIKTVNDFNFGGDDVGILCENVNDYINKLQDLKDMKFDKVIMNPPYDGELHLQILETVSKIGNCVINLAPVDWMLRTPNYFKEKSQFYKWRNKFANHLTDIIGPFDIDTAISLFGGARIAVSLAITKYNSIQNNDTFFKSITTDTVDAIICKKIFDFAKQDNIDKHLQINKKDGYRVKFTRIGGGNWTARKPHTLDCFKQIIIDGLLPNGNPHWMMNRINQYTKKTEFLSESLEFTSKENAQNFIDVYNNSKIITYYLGFVHQDMHLHPEYFPYINTENKITDEELVKLFNLTEAEYEHIKEYYAINSISKLV